MTKIMLYNHDARQALEQGMHILAQAVGVTLGPKGKNVVLERKFASPEIINDGVTIAKEIELKHPIKNTGAALLRQVASKTNEIAGDGTTTATVLAYGMVKEGIKHIIAGTNPVPLKKGMEKAVKFLVSKIHEYAQPVQTAKDIVNVASISAGNDLEVGEMISKAIQEIGRDGVILLEENQSTYTSLEFTEGLRFDKGFLSPYFMSNASDLKIMQRKPYILLADKKIKLAKQELIPLLEKVAKTNRPLLIIAEDIEKEALATLIVNKLQGVINVVAVRAPGFGDRRREFLEDLAILTGADIISDDLGVDLEKVTLENMGTADSANIFKNHTTIISSTNKNTIQLHCEQIRTRIECSNNDYEKEKLQERISKLAGKVAIIKLGAVTETEMKHKKLRLEDAISATRAAIEEGILPGGGSTMVSLSKELSLWSHSYLSDEELIGALIIANSLFLPLQKIVQNAGFDAPLIVNRVLDTDFTTGYDANKNMIVNMYLSGIIDPAKVIRLALQNAASIASIILTTECVIVDKNQENLY